MKLKLRRLPQPPESGCRISPNLILYSVDFPQIWFSDLIFFLKPFLGTLWFTPNLTQWVQVNLNVRGRANQSRNLSCSQFSLSYGPSKILQPLSGGCGTRLRIRNKSKKTIWWWDELACLYTPDSCLAFLHVLFFSEFSWRYWINVILPEAPVCWETEWCLGRIHLTLSGGRYSAAEAACVGSLKVIQQNFQSFSPCATKPSIKVFRLKKY